MTYDRRQIMQDAWTIARRFAHDRRTWAERLSAALKLVWWDAKAAVTMARRMAAKKAAKAQRFSEMSTDALRGAVLSMRAADRLGWEGMRQLHEYEAELARREHHQHAMAA